jgi:hypothetical protein
MDMNWLEATLEQPMHEGTCSCPHVDVLCRLDSALRRAPFSDDVSLTGGQVTGEIQVGVGARYPLTAPSVKPAMNRSRK